jgi:hypothetical protein
MAKIEDFRQRAADCLTLSERSLVPRHKELFLRMAQTWLALAGQEAGMLGFDPLAKVSGDADGVVSPAIGPAKVENQVAAPPDREGGLASGTT